MVSAESPRAAARPQRHGIHLELMAGPSLCVGAGPGGGRCDPAAAARGTPQLGLGGTVGWRFNDWLLLGAGGSVAQRRSGLNADGNPAFSGIRTMGGYGVLRLAWVLGRNDLYAEMGAGWSRLQMGVLAAGGPAALESSGFSLRPALGLHRWFISDFGAGLRLEGMFNLHTRFCADQSCGPDVGYVPAAYRDVFVHGLILGIDLAAMLHLRNTP